MLTQVPKAPFWFLKPAGALIASGQPHEWCVPFLLQCVCVVQWYGVGWIEGLGLASLPSSPCRFTTLWLKPKHETSNHVHLWQSHHAPVCSAPGASDTHHELELGVVIRARARRVRKEDAMAHVAGFCLALDMTDRGVREKLNVALRALLRPSIGFLTGWAWCVSCVFCAARDRLAGAQEVAKAEGKPWSAAKGWDTSCPVSDFVAIGDMPCDHKDLTMWLKVQRRPCRAPHCLP